MAKEKIIIPPDDIPAWFMTYSDVITLLMTFFILLLTFSTTEPERFEKVQSSIHTTGGATGLVGETLDGLSNDSWVARVRPPAARISTRGSEMPPLMRATAKRTFGKGLRSLTDAEGQNDLAASHFFDVDIANIVDHEGQMTPQGMQLCKLLSSQLEALPFHASLQFGNIDDSAKIVRMMSFLIDEQQTRPGQIGMSLVKQNELGSGKVRIMIIRFERTTT